MTRNRRQLVHGTWKQFLADSRPSQSMLRVVEPEELLSTERSFIPYHKLDAEAFAWFTRVGRMGLPIQITEKGLVF